MGRFEDKVVWITGASSGIGRALALELARQGASVALSARRGEEIAAVAAEIEAAGGRAIAVGCDVTDEGAVTQAVAGVVDQLGSLDIAIANAGIGVSGKVADLTAAHWRRQFEVNVVGAASTARASLPHLQKSGGQVVLIGSTMAYLTMPGQGAYAASKYALRALGQTLSMELHGSPVVCTTIHPAFVDSDIARVDNDGVLHKDRRDPRPKGVMWSADKAARVFARVIASRRREWTMAWYGKIGAWLGAHWPGLIHVFMTRFAPKPS